MLLRDGIYFCNRNKKNKKAIDSHLLLNIHFSYTPWKKEIEIENIALKILDVVYTDYGVYIDECERIMIVIITTIY